MASIRSRKTPFPARAATRPGAPGRPANSRSGESNINVCLEAAWDQLHTVLALAEHGRRLDLSEQVVLREVREAWHCPVTRRVLDTTVMGLTPYVAKGLTDSDLKARHITMPRLGAPFWRKPTDAPYSRDQIDEAIRSDPDIAALERIGVWQGLSRRISTRRLLSSGRTFSPTRRAASRQSRRSLSRGHHQRSELFHDHGDGRGYRRPVGGSHEQRASQSS